MKVFVLTCINESCELVMMKVFKTIHLARAEMIEDYNAELEDAGGEDACDFFKLGFDTACVEKDHEWKYFWQISSDEI